MSDVVIIVADSLRTDALGCMGAEVRTPTIDGLAAEGTVFDRVISAAPWTVPSIASMMTGVYSHRLGLAKWEQPWPREHPSLFDRAVEGGMRASSFVFDTGHLFKRVPQAGVVGSSQNTNGLLSFLKERRDEPAVIFIHYWWTHIPYVDTPMTMGAWKQTSDRVLDALRLGGAAREGVKGLYRRAVQRFSEVWLPQVLNALDLDNTWLVLTADHGESFGEREETASLCDVFDLHGNTLYDEVLRVPLIIRPPGGGVPNRVGQLVRTVDIAPTVCDLLDLEALSADQKIDGVSLGECIRSGATPPELEAVSVMNRDFVDMPTLPKSPEDLWSSFALTTGQYKYIWHPKTNGKQIFDLNADPHEVLNIYLNSEKKHASRWHCLLDERARARIGEVLPSDVEKVKQRLRNLGYLE